MNQSVLKNNSLLVYLLGFIVKANMFYYSRGFTVRVHAKVTPTARTAPLNAPVRTLSTAHQSTGRASAKRVKTLHRDGH